MKQIASVNDSDSGVGSSVLPCTLDRSTQDLIKLIFDTDMFNTALKDLGIGGWGMCVYCEDLGIGGWGMCVYTVRIWA